MYYLYTTINNTMDATVDREYNTTDNPTDNTEDNIVDNPTEDNTTDNVAKDPETCLFRNSTPMLVISSLIFITNSLTAYYCGYYLYSALFLFLTITSVIVHSDNNYCTNIIDKFAVAFIVLYGGYMLFNKFVGYMLRIKGFEKREIIYFSVSIIAFLICVYFYVYGFITGQYCFCPDVDKQNLYHSIIHMISSFGHHLVIFM